MRTGKRLIISIILLFTFFIFYSITFANDAYVFESNWSVTVDFVDNTPNAILFVEVWKYDQDTAVLLETYTETRALTCSVPKNVTLKDNKAYFDGSAGIRCALPSLQDIVYQLTDGDYKLPDECTCKTGAIVRSDVTLSPNNSATDWDNPLATMEDIQFSSPIKAGNVLRSSLEMIVASETAVSKPFAIQKNNLLQGSFDEINPYNAPAFTYLVEFIANADLLGATPNIINTPLLISNIQPTLYIGYNPATNQGLHGVMSDLFVDPGCFGNGGY